MSNVRIGRSDEPYDSRLERFPTLVHAFVDSAVRAPDRAALQCLDKSLSYRDYFRAVTTLSDRLVSLGARGGRVATKS